MIFPTASSLQDFDIVLGRYAFRKLDYLSKESPILDFSKGKLVIALIYFRILFKVHLGLK